MPQQQQVTGGPYIGPRGGKWADPDHTIPWTGPSTPRSPKAEEEKPASKGGAEHLTKVGAKLSAYGVTTEVVHVTEGKDPDVTLHTPGEGAKTSKLSEITSFLDSIPADKWTVDPPKEDQTGQVKAGQVYADAQIRVLISSVNDKDVTFVDEDGDEETVPIDAFKREFVGKFGMKPVSDPEFANKIDSIQRAKAEAAAHAKRIAEEKAERRKGALGPIRELIATSEGGKQLYVEDLPKEHQATVRAIALFTGEAHDVVRDPGKFKSRPGTSLYLGGWASKGIDTSKLEGERWTREDFESARKVITDLASREPVDAALDGRPLFRGMALPTETADALTEGTSFDHGDMSSWTLDEKMSWGFAGGAGISGFHTVEAEAAGTHKRVVFVLPSATRGTVLDDLSVMPEEREFLSSGKVVVDRIEDKEFAGGTYKVKYVHVRQPAMEKAGKTLPPEHQKIIQDAFASPISKRKRKREVESTERTKVEKAAPNQTVPWSSRRVEVGPPPKNNRKKYPFQGTIDFQGLKIDIENKRGSYREGTDGDGHKWRTFMRHHYGEIRGTEGVDGDKLDAYVGPYIDSALVVVVHQNHPDTGKYDEDKVMLGFQTRAEAITAYKRQYDRPGFLGRVTVLPIGQFWRWVQDRNNRGKRVLKKGKTMPRTIHGKPINESVWERAKAAARKSGTTKDFYALVMHIYKKMMSRRGKVRKGSMIQPLGWVVRKTPNGLKLEKQPFAVGAGWSPIPQDPYGGLKKTVNGENWYWYPSRGLAERAARLGLVKGFGHKYIKRVPYRDAQGRTRYRYFYQVQHGGGVGNTEHIKEGAAFKYKEGHYHVEKEHGDGTVTLKHDESGETKRAEKAHVAALLHDEHGEAVKEHARKLRQDITVAFKHGTTKQVARLAAHSAKLGYMSEQQAKDTVAAHKAHRAAGKGPEEEPERGEQHGLSSGKAAQYLREKHGLKIGEAKRLLKEEYRGQAVRGKGKWIGDRFADRYGFDEKLLDKIGQKHGPGVKPEPKPTEGAEPVTKRTRGPKAAAQRAREAGETPAPDRDRKIIDAYRDAQAAYERRQTQKEAAEKPTAAAPTEAHEKGSIEEMAQLYKLSDKDVASVKKMAANLIAIGTVKDQTTANERAARQYITFHRHGDKPGYLAPTADQLRETRDKLAGAKKKPKLLVPKKMLQKPKAAPAVAPVSKPETKQPPPAEPPKTKRTRGPKAKAAAEATAQPKTEVEKPKETGSQWDKEIPHPKTGQPVKLTGMERAALNVVMGYKPAYRANEAMTHGFTRGSYRQTVEGLKDKGVLDPRGAIWRGTRDKMLPHRLSAVRYHGDDQKALNAHIAEKSKAIRAEAKARPKKEIEHTSLGELNPEEHATPVSVTKRIASAVAQASLSPITEDRKPLDPKSIQAHLDHVVTLAGQRGMKSHAKSALQALHKQVSAYRRKAGSASKRRAVQHGRDAGITRHVDAHYASANTMENMIAAARERTAAAKPAAKSTTTKPAGASKEDTIEHHQAQIAKLESERIGLRRKIKEGPIADRDKHRWRWSQTDREMEAHKRAIMHLTSEARYPHKDFPPGKMEAKSDDVTTRITGGPREGYSIQSFIGKNLASTDRAKTLPNARFRAQHSHEYAQSQRTGHYKRAIKKEHERKHEERVAKLGADRYGSDNEVKSAIGRHDKEIARLNAKADAHAAKAEKAETAHDRAVNEQHAKEYRSRAIRVRNDRSDLANALVDRARRAKEMDADMDVRHTFASLPKTTAQDRAFDKLYGDDQRRYFVEHHKKLVDTARKAAPPVKWEKGKINIEGKQLAASTHGDYAVVSRNEHAKATVGNAPVKGRKADHVVVHKPSGKVVFDASKYKRWGATPAESSEQTAKYFVEHVVGTGASHEGAQAHAVENHEVPSIRKLVQGQDLSNEQNRALLESTHEAVKGKAPTPESFQVNTQTLGKDKALKRAARFASDDGTRTNLMHPFVRKGNMYATDGHRAIALPTDAEAGYHWHPNRGAPPFADKMTFPDAEKLFKKSNSTHHFDAGHIQAITNLGVKSKRGHVLLEAHKGALTATIPKTSTDPTLPKATSSGDTPKSGVRVAINPKYLADALAGAKGTVRVGISTARDPVVIHREDGERHIIMPIRID